MMASEAQALGPLPSQKERLQFVTHRWDLAAFGGVWGRPRGAGQRSLRHPRGCSTSLAAVC